MSAEQFIIEYLDLWTEAVTTKSTSGRGSNGKIELTGIKKLRELILELAARGKLVPQDSNDGPASMLLKEIAAKKLELVRSGTIKKRKAMSSFINAVAQVPGLPARHAELPILKSGVYSSINNER